MQMTYDEAVQYQKDLPLMPKSKRLLMQPCKLRREGELKPWQNRRNLEAGSFYETCCLQGKIFEYFNGLYISRG